MEKITNQVKRISENIPEAIVKSEVKKFGSVHLGFPGNDLGDIDVLIVLPKIKSIVLVECKNVVIARTPIEMRRELEELFIDTEKTLSTMTKVNRRHKWVQDNLGSVLSSLNFELRGMWKVNSLLVTSDELITPYFYRPSIEVISYLRFVEDYLPGLDKRVQRIRN